MFGSSWENNNALKSATPGADRDIKRQSRPERRVSCLGFKLI